MNLQAGQMMAVLLLLLVCFVLICRKGLILSGKQWIFTEETTHLLIT